MEILGIGPLELIFILIIALIVLGPNDMVKAGRTLGRLMRKVVTSPTWRTLQDASREMRNLPNRLMREAGIEEIQNQLPNTRQLSKDLGTEQLKAEITDMQRDLTVSTGQAPTIKPPETPENEITDVAEDTYMPDDSSSTEDPSVTIDTPENPPSIPTNEGAEASPGPNNPAVDSPESPADPTGHE